MEKDGYTKNIDPTPSEALQTMEKNPFKGKYHDSHYKSEERVETRRYPPKNLSQGAQSVPSVTD